MMTDFSTVVSQLQGQGRVSTATRNGTVLLMLPPLTVTRTPTVAEQAPPATLATTTRPAAMSLESRGIETVTRANGAVTVVDFPPPPDPRLPPSTTSYDSEGNVVGVKTYLGAYPGQTIEGLEKGFAAAEKINEAKMQACLRVAKIHADKGDWEYNDIHDCVPDGQKQWLSANDGNH